MEQNKKTISIAEQKQIELCIMDVIDEFCTENNLTYYMTGGTLLGAVRHHGFIPWDDDIDISMKRSDYQVLLDKFNEDQEGPYKLIWHGNRYGSGHVL